MCDVYGGPEVCKPEDWLSQYQDACKKDLFNEGIDPNAVEEDAENMAGHQETRMEARSQRTTRGTAAATQQQSTQSASSNNSTLMEYKATRLRQRNA